MGCSVNVEGTSCEAEQDSQQRDMSAGETSLGQKIPVGVQEALQICVCRTCSGLTESWIGLLKKSTLHYILPNPCFFHGLSLSMQIECSGTKA